MLPSMPILFTRESQDAFGNKIVASTSVFNQNADQNIFVSPELPPPKPPDPPKIPAKEAKGKASAKKKEDPPAVSYDALETALVKAYYSKVQSKFSSNQALPTNKFVQFQNILKTFNPAEETPVDLYKKVETLFGEEHKEYTEDFLLFLKPGQAAQVGRYTDHFLLVQMNEFIRLLQCTFSRKPTILRKILRALTAAANSGNADEMKRRVFPHLRAHPRILQMYKTLFMDERPPDSVYESNVNILDESFLTNTVDYDVWEFEEQPEKKKKVVAKEGLDTVYLHGRVFLQHGRMLRPARVTYPYSKEPYRVHAKRLASPNFRLSPTQSDDETSSSKRTKKTPKITPKKRPAKSPTKNVKDVNDNTKVKDCTVNSPKTKAKPKSKCKEKDTVPKRDRKDNKNHTSQKKEEVKIKMKDDLKEVVKLKGEMKVREEVKVKGEVRVKVELKVKEEKVKETVKSKTVTVKSNGSDWTRDEDKTMLQVLKGESGSDEIFGRIKQLLPHRTSVEIKERFCHVMNLLQQMAVGEVT